MCGRFHLQPDEDFYPRFGIKHKDDDYHLSPNTNISPGQRIATIISGKKGITLTPMKWGFIPVWATDERIGYKMINARAETVADKPSFKNAFKTSRCLIPATGFYEWETRGKEKTPHLFQPEKVKYFAIAGLYSIWTSPDKKQIPTCTLITTEADRVVGKYHNRMPVILDRNDEDKWLSVDDPDFLEDLVRTPVNFSLRDSKVKPNEM